MDRSTRRKTVLLVAATLAGFIAVSLLVVWVLPSVLTMHPHVRTAAERHNAEAAARTGLVAFVGVLGALGGLYYTSRTVRVSREAQNSANTYASETSRLSQQTLDLSERGQITDRYSKAVAQLGSQSPEVCVGAIYALGQIMIDSGRYERPIVAVLSAFIRRRAKRRDDLDAPWPADEAERDEVKPSFAIQAALNVLIESRPLATPPDLRDADLRGARLRGGQLAGASFRRSYLYKAKLPGANLRGAAFVNADLTGAQLLEADLTGADMKRARLTRGSITAAQLEVLRSGDEITWVPREPDTIAVAGEDEGQDPV